MDKVVLVAGAAPGNIGAAIATRLAEEGAAVVAADLDGQGAEAVARDIAGAGGRATAQQLDITDEASYRELVGFTVQQFGGLDGLANVAADLSPGGVGRDTDVVSTPLDVWQHTIDVTLTGYMYGIRHALPIMLDLGGGSIVNMMSSAVWLGETARVSYQAAKAGLYGLTRHTASLGGKRGVRCNSVAPGITLTAAAKAVLGEGERAEFLAAVRSPRLGEPADIAATVAFLLSDDAAYINGQTVLVDGGHNFS
jgi:NAD(P)-dependent dehydrogenase (short-subunit alcohol dehydrogenase family)